MDRANVRRGTVFGYPSERRAAAKDAPGTRERGAGCDVLGGRPAVGQRQPGWSSTAVGLADWAAASHLARPFGRGHRGDIAQRRATAGQRQLGQNDLSVGSSEWAVA